MLVVAAALQGLPGASGAAELLTALHAHAAPLEALGAQPVRRLGTHAGQRVVHLVGLREVAGEGALARHALDLLAPGRLAHGRGVDAARPRHELGPHAAQLRHQGLVGTGQLAQALYPQPPQGLLGLGPHARQRTHAQGLQEARLAPRVHHGQAVGLVALAGYLAHGLAGGEPNGARHAQLAHAGADAPAHRHGILARIASRRHVEVRLVDAHLLQVGRLVEDDGHHLGGHLAVALMPAGHPDGLRAEPTGLCRGHGRVHAERPRFIRAGAHHAATRRVASHDEGLAAPLGMVELLHRGEERVEVEQAHGPSRPGCKYVGGSLFHAVSIRRPASPHALVSLSCSSRVCGCGPAPAGEGPSPRQTRSKGST